MNITTIYPGLKLRSPHKPIIESMYLENRFKMLTKSKPEEAKRLIQQAQQDVNSRWRMYQYLAEFNIGRAQANQGGKNHD
jgi:pyruvate-ferredoxin/flavodoxin oxidoreductase